ncbi:glycosyltransferase involved in cell wall biosynthesis [Symbiobacterium terraclitae]|uniref:Glycosyltransferase involved in cell wall biosynthesis n=1 Tax=Symbiobacterium terraclitae TaxID=557451 RepID=A0ABS4JWE1_9FIRM|nr:glycosyltransferase family 4 protein [Symbiobacterium terraclitae]MBP2019858.1 glycosyltransferase involved in cell wall biosynthesis [Symbiobacterium terraclitae]
MSRPRVVHVTSVHPAHDIRIFHKECRTLAAAGYEVILLATGDAGGDSGGAPPGGLSGRCGGRGEGGRWEDVRIRMLPRPRRRWQRMTTTLYRIYRAALEERADCYHLHDPELLPVGLLLRRRGRRVVYDVHEDVPLQVLSKHWIPPWLRPWVSRLVRRVEAFCARRLDGAVAATPAIARKCAAWGVPCMTVQNFPLPAPEPFDGTPYTARGPLVVYVGAITAERGLREMVAAMARLPESLGARLVLAGEFSPAGLAEEARAWPGWERVIHLGWQDRQQVQRLLGSARVGLALLHPEPNYVECYSTKSFEYLQAGLPVVASDFPLWRSVLGETGGAVLVDPLDPDAIARAVQHLLEHPEEARAMGEAGRRAAAERFTWEKQAEELLAFYRRLLGTGAGDSPDRRAAPGAAAGTTGAAEARMGAEAACTTGGRAGS